MIVPTGIKFLAPCPLSLKPYAISHEAELCRKNTISHVYLIMLSLVCVAEFREFRPLCQLSFGLLGAWRRWFARCQRAGPIPVTSVSIFESSLRPGGRARLWFHPWKGIVFRCIRFLKLRNALSAKIFFRATPLILTSTALYSANTAQTFENL